MNYKRRDGVAQSILQVDSSTAERCNCLPLSSLQAVPPQKQEEDTVDYDKVTPATHELNTHIRAQLAIFSPRAMPLSLLLLHVSQLEHISIAPQSAILHKRERYHAPASFLEQVLVNVRRAIRSSDQLLIHDGVGAAIIFPEVDHQGINAILERIYRSVSLLQAETVIPPLKRETDIVMGVGSHPAPGVSIEPLLYQVSATARRLTLRPAITAQLWPVQSINLEEITASSVQDISDGKQSAQMPHNVPFLQLPTKLPTRLKQLIPHSIALELRCAPVGRDHHCLTIAMADPTNTAAIEYLRETTGLTIFPVSCNVTVLDLLLANKW